MNYFFIATLWIVIGYKLSISDKRVTPPRRDELTAVSFSLHAQRLYLRVRTDDSPYQTNDPALFDEHVQDCICEDVTKSGFFRSLHYVPVDRETIRRRRREPIYSKMFQHLYTYNRFGPRSPNPYVYTNSFRQLDFLITRAYWVTEHVFVCPVQHSLVFDMDPLYVSKVYNVNTSVDNQPYKPGRFVIGNFMPAIPRMFGFDFVMLAEEPAVAYTFEEGINAEIYYLRIRKYIEPAESNRIDPLCKLISADDRDPNNQHHRFCVAVSSSSYFVNKIRYVLRREAKPCSKKRISFKTAAGVSAEANGRLFYERVARCDYVRVNPPNTVGFFYISRAYGSNQVLVYSSSPTDGRIYVENLSANVSILDELNAFDFVEE